MDVSPATILGPLALLQPVTKFLFLLSTVLTPLGTKDSLRQLINKPESTSGDSSFISLHRLPVQIPFDLSIELQIRQQRKNHTYEFSSSMVFWASIRLLLYT